MDEDVNSLTHDELVAEVGRLRDGIRLHRDSSGQDLCWHHPQLWGLLPERVDPAIAIPPWPQFLHGCVKYRESLDREQTSPAIGALSQGAPRTPPATSPLGANQPDQREPMLELPIKDPCDLCEGMAGREERWAIIDESAHTLTVINPWQFEVGQCCVITRRHVATLLDLSVQECEAILVSAKKVAEALVKTYRPLGILTFQNNGVFSGQETPHFHLHVVPRQNGSDWGVGPPQLATFDGAGRIRGTSHDPGGDAQRRERVRVSARQLTETAALIRSNLPE